MSKTLEEIRKKLQSLEVKKGGGESKFADKATYPHWNIAEGTSVTLRFLPDANEDNPLFWSERQLIKLEFPGIVGETEKKRVVVAVPCIEMWTGKNTCPILNEVRPMWKDDSLVEIARKYWVKKTYYAQGFVKNSPMPETDLPENPIRKFIIGPQIFAILKAALMDPDMTNSPVDYINGTDFIVTKTSKGGYADYGTSKWARKESSLSDEAIASIEKYGLVNLSTYLPKRPTDEQLAIMFDMFQDSLEGQLYDPEKYGQHFKPQGYDASTDAADGGEKIRTRTTMPAKPTFTAAKPVVDNSVEPEDEVIETPKVAPAAPAASTNTTGKSPQEILAMLRNRNK
jgi:hypothetical protein